MFQVVWGEARGGTIGNVTDFFFLFRFLCIYKLVSGRNYLCHFVSLLSRGVGLNANINIEVTDGIRWNRDTRYLLKIHMNHCRFIITGG